MENYKDRLAAAMKASGNTDAQLAKSLGVSIQAVRKVAAGTTTAFTAENNSKAAQFLRVDPDWLATGAGEMISEKVWPFVLVTPRQIQSLNAKHLEMVQKFALDLLETQLLPIASIAPTPNTEVKGSRKGVILKTGMDRSRGGNSDQAEKKTEGPAGSR